MSFTDMQKIERANKNWKKERAGGHEKEELAVMQLRYAGATPGTNNLDVKGSSCTDQPL